METIKPSFTITFHYPECYPNSEVFIETVARTCYKSESKFAENSASDFIRNTLVQNGHLAMVEHCVATVRFIADRGFTHEIVRHRLASFAQESTRFCNYSKGKFNSQITVIAIPEETNPSDELLQHYQRSMGQCEKNYFKALELGAKPQIARMFLPIGLKAEIVVTANLREWMKIFELRTSKAAHPIMRKIMTEVQSEFAREMPSIFSQEGNRK